MYNFPERFQVVIEVSTMEEICMFEMLLEDESLKDLYSFTMVQVDTSTSKTVIMYGNEIMGAIHGRVTVSFLKKIHSRIEETFKDYGKTENTVLQMQ